MAAVSAALMSYLKTGDHVVRSTNQTHSLLVYCIDYGHVYTRTITVCYPGGQQSVGLYLSVCRLSVCLQSVQRPEKRV